MSRRAVVQVITQCSEAAAAAAPVVAPAADLELLVALRSGDEAAFAGLVRRLHAPMLRLAMSYVSSRAVAEEVVQEAWLGVLQQLDRFEGRSSLKTWILRIVSNQAKTRAAQERRSMPLSALRDPAADEEPEPAVEPERFFGAGHRWAGHWVSPPRSWEEIPEDRLLSEETRAEVERAIAALPPNQRAVISLRDVHGWTGGEVCIALGLTEVNQRVLLHRARAKVRRALEQYLDGAYNP
jgi:RNA polymerase sigma-70 factor, ECF subfamily